MADPEDPAESPTMGDVLAELAELEAMLDDETAQEHVQETIETARRARDGTVFGRIIHGFDRADLAEATVGAFIFGIPMFVEGGTQEVGHYLARHPVWLALTVALGVGLTVGILYVADIQDVRVANPVFGVVPRRLIGVLGTSALTAAALMTIWGRVDWSVPVFAISQIAVAFVPMTIGAALGDILPGS